MAIYFTKIKNEYVTALSSLRMHPWTIYGLVDVELEDMTAEIVSETLETEQELNILFDVDRILNRAQ